MAPKKNTRKQETTDKARKAALAEIDARLAGVKADHEVPSAKEVANNAVLGATTQKAKGGKAPKAAKAPRKPKRMSALDAAAQVIAGSKVPLRAKELIAEMESKGLWKSPGGKTPEASLYAAMIREIAAKGDKARFRRHDKGVFVAGKEA